MTPAGDDTSSISACLVVHNEEKLIERCLASLDGVVDEIVLVHDGPCADRTLEIARSHGARTFVQPRAGHGERWRVLAYEQARGDWILRVDADMYLSPELRQGLPQLVTRSDVNGYAFILPIWNGTRALTTAGPYHTALFRRERAHLLGMIQEPERVDPPVERVPLVLEHRPAYDNYSWRTMLSKWRRWAKVHADELLLPFDAIPKYNWTGSADWPPRRRLLTRLMPFALPPYMLLFFLRNLSMPATGSRWMDLKQAAGWTFYNAMVEWYVGTRKLRGSRADPRRRRRLR